MTPLFFSPQAETDLEEIGDFIARDNPIRALSFVRELKSKCLPLQNAPGIGASRPELGEGIRMVPHGRYLIFYREQMDAVRVERVMHSARDINNDDFVLDG